MVFGVSALLIQRSSSCADQCRNGQVHPVGREEPEQAVLGGSPSCLSRISTLMASADRTASERIGYGCLPQQGHTMAPGSTRAPALVCAEQERRHHPTVAERSQGRDNSHRLERQGAKRPMAGCRFDRPPEPSASHELCFLGMSREEADAATHSAARTTAPARKWRTRSTSSIESERRCSPSMLQPFAVLET